MTRVEKSYLDGRPVDNKIVKDMFKKDKVTYEGWFIDHKDIVHHKFRTK